MAIPIALYWAGAALLAAFASGCAPSKEPPTPDPKTPEPVKPNDGVEAQQKLREITAPTCQKTCNPFVEDKTGLLMLREDRVSVILSEICPGVKEAIAKDRSTLAQDALEQGLESYYLSEINDLDLTKLDRQISLYCKLGHLTKTDSHLWMTLGHFYIDKEEMDKAEKAYELALATSTFGNNTSITIMLAFLGLGELNRLQGDHDRAIEYYREAAIFSRRFDLSEDWSAISQFLEIPVPEDLESWLKKEDQKEYLPQYQDHFEAIEENVTDRD